MFLGTLLLGCGGKGDVLVTLPQLFQVTENGSDPAYLATNVPLNTSEIFVYFTEPVDLSTVNNNYKFVETLGASSTDRTDLITGVDLIQGGNGLLFRVGGTLTYNAGYTLTLYPSIVSSTGNYLAFLTRVSFTTGPTDSFGYGEVIIENAPPTVVGDIERDLYCGCLNVYATFSESLATPPIFSFEINNLFGLLGNFASGGSGLLSTYPARTYDGTTWGVSLGCMPQNQAADRVLKIKVIGSSVIDLNGDKMIGDKERSFSNPWIYSCP